MTLTLHCDIDLFVNICDNINGVARNDLSLADNNRTINRIKLADMPIM